MKTKKDNRMSKKFAPHRADIVGSFLRPARLHEARARFQQGEISAADLKQVEDEWRIST